MGVFDNLQKDIEIAFSLLYNSHSVDDFKLYPWSNERINKYYNYYDQEHKNVLCITASGDHALYAINGGAKKIDCVDINPLCKYYLELKKSLILAYNEDDFFNHYCKIIKILTTKINLNDIKPYMDENAFVFWNEIINSRIFKKNKRLFREDGLPIKFNMDYNNLKRNLSNAQITYYDDDIKDYLLNTSESYDVIFLSNVNEWQKNYKDYILSKSLEKLNDNGLIYEAYFKYPHQKDYSHDNLEKKIITVYGYPHTEFPESGAYVYRKK